MQVSTLTVLRLQLSGWPWSEHTEASKEGIRSPGATMYKSVSYNGAYLWLCFTLTLTFSAMIQQYCNSSTATSVNAAYLWACPETCSRCTSCQSCWYRDLMACNQHSRLHSDFHSEKAIAHLMFERFHLLWMMKAARADAVSRISAARTIAKIAPPA